MEAGGTDTLLCLLRDATAAAAAGHAPGAAAAAPDSAGPESDASNDGGVADGGARKGPRGAAAELARGAAGALRQLANSDAVKSQLAELGVLESIVRCAALGPGRVQLVCLQRLTFAPAAAAANLGRAARAPHLLGHAA
jgi:hypothetical protein